MSWNKLSELRSFGFTLASGVDVDGNMYNGRKGLGRRERAFRSHDITFHAADLAVGALYSQTVVLFR